MLLVCVSAAYHLYTYAVGDNMTEGQAAEQMATTNNPSLAGDDLHGEPIDSSVLYSDRR